MMLLNDGVNDGVNDGTTIPCYYPAIADGTATEDGLLLLFRLLHF